MIVRIMSLDVFGAEPIWSVRRTNISCLKATFSILMLVPPQDYYSTIAISFAVFERSAVRVWMGECRNNVGPSYARDLSSQRTHEEICA